jgi:allophanate hydrolase subunit 2
VTITIVTAGITVIEDSGRKEFTSIGVPVSGAFDKLSHILACNLIHENNSPAFEILRGPFQLTSTAPIVLTVVGDAKVIVAGAISSVNSVFVLEASKTLLVEPITCAPVYVAIKGLLTQSVLGSYSYDTLSKLGPGPLSDGDSFEIRESDGNDSTIGSFISSMPKTVVTEICYVSGPHSLDVKGNWKVEAIARSGVRLSSPTPLQNNLASLASFPVMPGAIQVPPGGLPIILGPDCGVTGGYPVAGVVIDADLHKLARLTTGSNISLVPVTQEEASLASQSLTKAIANAITRPSDLGAW